MGELIALLKALVSFNTENPPGNEYRVVSYIRRFFCANKIRYKVYAKDEKRQNIVGLIGKGKPYLLISCHSDTVPAGTGWKTNPFSCTIKGGFAYGRGVADNKGPMAALLIAAKKLKKHEKMLKGTLMIGIFADEEQGSAFGLRHVLKKLKPGFAIMPDIGHNMKAIDVAEKGVLRLELVSKGKAAHGASPEKGINAITNLNEVLVLLSRIVLKHKKHPLLSGPTINTGMIEGGTAPNVVPDYARVVLDIRYLPSQSPEGIIRQIKAVIATAKRKNKKINIKVKKLLSMKPSRIKSSHKLVKIIQSSTKKITGIRPKPIGLSGATDAKVLVLNGIAAVGFGCGDDNQAHAPNESIRIKELENFSKVIEEIVKVILAH